jgi:hypothetical protein
LTPTRAFAEIRESDKTSRRFVQSGDAGGNLRCVGRPDGGFAACGQASN